MQPHHSPKVAVAPKSADYLDHAIESAGADLVDLDQATAVVWTSASRPDALDQTLRDSPAVDWVQLPWAGVEPYIGVVRRHPAVTFTCAKGAYSEPVAEHALALLLAGLRGIGAYARDETWGRESGRNLFGAHVTIVGGGGIAGVLIELLRPFACEVTVVRRSAEPMSGVVRVLGIERLHQALEGAEALVLALPINDETRAMIGAAELALLAPGAWLVNVARGEHVVTEDLLAALDHGTLGGAALDVTDPEPLEDGHPLWGRDNVIITPHTANTREMAKPLLARRIRENVRAYISGEPLSGLVDPTAGY